MEAAPGVEEKGPVGEGVQEQLSQLLTDRERSRTTCLKIKRNNVMQSIVQLLRKGTIPVFPVNIGETGMKVFPYGDVRKLTHDL